MSSPVRSNGNSPSTSSTNSYESGSENDKGVIEENVTQDSLEEVYYFSASQSEEDEEASIFTDFKKVELSEDMPDNQIIGIFVKHFGKQKPAVQDSILKQAFPIRSQNPAFPECSVAKAVSRYFDNIEPYLIKDVMAVFASGLSLEAQNALREVLPTPYNGNESDSLTDPFANMSVQEKGKSELNGSFSLLLDGLQDETRNLSEPSFSPILAPAETSEELLEKIESPSPEKKETLKEIKKRIENVFPFMKKKHSTKGQ